MTQADRQMLAYWLCPESTQDLREYDQAWLHQSRLGFYWRDPNKVTGLEYAEVCAWVFR